MDKFEFEELDRLAISATTQLVLSKAKNAAGEVTGYSVGKYKISARYTGFSGGVFVPVEKFADFMALLGKIK